MPKLWETDEEILDGCRRGWRSGLAHGTECGLGSSWESTENIRWWLPEIAEKYDFKIVCDAGAGDLHWMKLVRWSVVYLPFDLVPRHHQVAELDILKEVLPPCDAILCRMVLNHFGQERTNQAIELFKQSGAKYLIANRYDNDGIDEPRPFRCVEIPLGEPLSEVPDGPDEGCYLALYEL